MNRSIGVWRKSENSKENEAKEEKRRGKMMRSVRKEEREIQDRVGRVYEGGQKHSQDSRVYAGEGRLKRREKKRSLRRSDGNWARR